MATKKKGTTRPPTSGSTSTSVPSIRIRMYRIGFGDCFLVTLDGQHHILVDCGVHNKGGIVVNGKSLIDLAFQNIVTTAGGKLDVVIATHAHQDHVSGYGKFADQFAKFNHIGEVWMPWTDDLSNATARSWHQKKKALVGLVQTYLTARADKEAQAAIENAGPNPAAMQALRQGFGKAKVRYLKAGDQLDAPAGVTGFSAKIMGPPEDQDFISKMNPPGSDHYLRMAAAQQTGKGTHPFVGWELSPQQMDPKWPQLKQNVVKMMNESLKFSARAVAFSLDKLLNNTSIVALLSWRGKHLLFPGDAEYGDWAYWYKKSGSQVLSDICFYKVAHHGSWNATPKGALAEMPLGAFGAMMSTQSSPWPSIPRPALEKAIDERTGGALLRSDSIPVAGAPAGPKLNQLPPAFVKGNLSKNEFWVDYNIP